MAARRITSSSCRMPTCRAPWRRFPPPRSVAPANAAWPAQPRSLSATRRITFCPRWSKPRAPSKSARPTRDTAGHGPGHHRPTSRPRVESRRKRRKRRRENPRRRPRREGAGRAERILHGRDDRGSGAERHDDGARGGFRAGAQRHAHGRSGSRHRSSRTNRLTATALPFSPTPAKPRANSNIASKPAWSASTSACPRRWRCFRSPAGTNRSTATFTSRARKACSFTRSKKSSRPAGSAKASATCGRSESPKSLIPARGKSQVRISKGTPHALL